MKDFILTNIRKAGNKAHELFGKSFKVEYKNYHDVVTSADYASERIILSAIKRKFPSHSIWSEEAGEKKGNSPYCWHIDPVDGTNNFFMGLPIWGVSMALYKGNAPLAAASYFPLQDELYYAEKGKGAYLNGKRIRVSDKKELKKSLLLLDDSAAFDSFKKKSITELTSNFFAIRVMGSACYSHALLARGVADAVFHAHLKQGDFAAGVLLIEEAGGKAQDPKRKRVEIEKTSSLLATNGKIHIKIRKLLKE